jgi:hypothetical protein
MNSRIDDSEFEQLIARLSAPITSEELAARQTVTTVVGRFPASDPWFGWCPTCGRHDGYLNLCTAQWFICEAHKKAWCLGDDEFVTWWSENESDWRRNYVHIHDYTKCDSQDWTVFSDPCKRVGIDLSSPDRRLWLTNEEQWLLAQEGCWQPPTTGWDGDGHAIPATREECREADTTHQPMLRCYTRLHRFTAANVARNPEPEQPNADIEQMFAGVLPESQPESSPPVISRKPRKVVRPSPENFTE